jgi:CheY-like chemotaxis protein
MSGLQDFLTPFSHLVFANRDKVIVLLAGILALVTIQLLVSRWRTERLRRDLATAKSGGSSGGGRRYVTTAPVVEEAPVESGGLPPVKGGRTYARNLGNALQKAGIGPQIYSPPSPPGWASNTNPPQPTMGQPGPPYAPQNVPWAAPAAPQGSPWGGYPAGGGRGMQAPAPNPAPFYQPQQQTPPQPMSQPIAPPPGVPGPFAPLVNSPFGPPAFPAVSSGPAGPPSFAPPTTPAAPPAPPAFAGPPPAAEPPAADPSGGDASRRGKPKRRRFNFNVLENLEKMVQSKTAEPAPTPAPPTWTPPVAGSPATWAPPGSAAAPAPAAAAPPASAVPAAPQPVAAAQPAPGVEATPPADEAPTEAESLPLSFGPAVEPEAEKEPEAQKEYLPLRFGPEVETETAESEPAELEPATFEKEPEPEPVVAEASEAEPEPQPEAEPEPVREARGSMRSMLFGEEAVAPHAPEPPAPEPVASEPDPVAAEHPWSARTYSPEPVTEAPESEKVQAWNATPSWEPEPQSETVATTEPEEAPAVPETPAVDGGSEPTAGTVVIIEDDPTAATYYATLFRGNGYRVEVANDGVSGVDLCTRLQPQLIMLDVMMPRQNGILVLQTLRASDETKNTPVVVMSNFSEPTLIKRAIQLGALEYVIKTQVEGPALLSALPRWMNHEKAFAAAA